VAAFDRAIPPGGEGKVNISVKTSGYDGRHRWGAKVLTNDPAWKSVILEVEALVKPVISVSPKRVSLIGEQDKTVKGTVQIRAMTERPLTLEVVGFSLQNDVTYQIRELEKGKAFDITFSTLPGRKQRCRGFLRLKTNYPERPDVTVFVYGG
jgi:hypothetical protein